MSWIGSQTTAVIIIVVFSLCYGVAALIFVSVRLLSVKRVAHDLKAITPVLLTPIGLIGGLLIAFLAARVWSNMDRAYGFALQEANSVLELRRLADELPPAVGDVLRQGAQSYADWVTSEDWPQMLRGNPQVKPVHPGLRQSMDAIAAYNPQEAGQRAILQSALAAVERTLEAQRNRVLLSRQVIESSQWTVIWLSYVFLLLTISFIHLDRPITSAVAAWLFSSVFAFCVVLLVLNDGPLSAGGHTIGPALMRELSQVD